MISTAATVWKTTVGSILMAMVLTPWSAARASSFRVVYSFTDQGDGGEPDYGSLIMDKNGNLYGTTALTSGNGPGAVFKLGPNGAERVLYTFKGGPDGDGPEALVMDAANNLWGVTCCGGIGGGVIFEITSKGREKLIHTFAGQPDDGCSAYSAMIIDTKGKLYGTTIGCGRHDGGAVFTLAPDGTESLIYSFSVSRGGNYPFAGLLMDANSNLYGTNATGGKHDDGTLFKITPNGGERVLHTFKGSPRDGATSDGTLIMDKAGDLYGTTNWGGRDGCFADGGCGTVFKRGSAGTQTVIHYFEGGRSDGSNPVAGMVADKAGNLYGTTEFGGGSTPCNGADGCGTIFKISPDSTESVLHKFKRSTDGANPNAGLVADAKGNLYGTATNGGKYGYGTVFEITP